ncbi:MAG: (5-formylfuran-3-yl)methyl phosphate synthase [Gammaproteobacteria bacterium]
MTGMLASVTGVEEAVLALTAEVDIIDLKQPAQGALGALELNAVKQIRCYCRGHRPVSATVGDLPMQPEVVFDAVGAMAETGVDYIKVGFFPGGDREGVIRKLSVLTRQNLSLIAVLFADIDPDPDPVLIETLKTSGFRGVMLDTMDKRKGSLTAMVAATQIRHFVMQVKSRHMMCGLAGSLKLDDVPGLIACRPDYLGFRGALCVQGERTARLDRRSVVRIKQAIEAGHSALSVGCAGDAMTETAI